MADFLYVVLRQENSHATTIVGDASPVTPDKDQADQSAQVLAKKYPGQKFIVARVIASYQVVPGLVSQQHDDE